MYIFELFAFIIAAGCGLYMNDASGRAKQSQANSLYLNLGSLHHKMKMRAVKIRGVFSNQYQ
jgi:hypothetical protein